MQCIPFCSCCKAYSRQVTLRPDAAAFCKSQA